jgi:hypothetical protein
MGTDGREKRKTTAQSVPVSLVATSWLVASQPNPTKCDPVQTAVVRPIGIRGISQWHCAEAATAIRQAKAGHTALSADLISEK